MAPLLASYACDGWSVVILAASCSVALLQMSVAIGTLMTWRSIDHACFVDEMRKARREKRRIIGWTSLGQPILDGPDTAVFSSESWR